MSKHVEEDKMNILFDDIISGKFPMIQARYHDPIIPLDYDKNKNTKSQGSNFKIFTDMVFLFLTINLELNIEFFNRLMLK